MLVDGDMIPSGSYMGFQVTCLAWLMRKGEKTRQLTHCVRYYLSRSGSGVLDLSSGITREKGLLYSLFCFLFLFLSNTVGGGVCCRERERERETGVE